MEVSKNLNDDWTENEINYCKDIIKEYNDLNLFSKLENYLEPWDDYSYVKAVFYGWVIAKYNVLPEQAIRISTFL